MCEEQRLDAYENWIYWTFGPVSKFFLSFLITNSGLSSKFEMKSISQMTQI